MNAIDSLKKYLPPKCTCWIAGGALRDHFMQGYPGSDIDLFFPDGENWSIAKEWYLDKARKSKIVYENSNTLKLYVKKFRKQIDLVKRFFPSPQATIAEFDFTVCCVAMDYEKVYHHDRFFIDLAARKLVINKLPYPISTLQRLQKYFGKGFRICNGGIIEIAKAIQKLSDEDIAKNHIEFYPDKRVRRIVRID